MTISAFLMLALGIVLLLFGRRAFWIFVSVAGFIAGLTFATQFMSGQSELVILLIAIVAGVIGAVLAIMLEWLAILIAGFLAGGFLATTLAVSLGITIASGNWVAYIIGGIIGLILVAALFDWAIIILSVLLGADLIVSGLSIQSSTYYWVIILVLIVVGIVVQAGYWHRRYPVKRTWGRRQSTNPCPNEDELPENRNWNWSNLMDTQKLNDTARALVADDKGLLAMDESNPTCNKRFAALGIPQTEPARRAYRELIVTTHGLGECISGAILFDETIRQQLNDGTPFIKAILDAGIIPGIKVDSGAKDMAGHPGEKITEGLDGLRERLAEYAQMGLRFTKWRAVIVIDEAIPSRGCIEANAQALARYAALCQEAGLVPIVEPEVLMDGEHDLERCREVTEEVLRTVFGQLYTQRVLLEGLILKPNMVLPGLACPKQATIDEVADATVTCLLRAVPAAVTGIAFLSGGQSAELASARLNAMNVRFKSRMPWALAFSFSRAIQQPALEIWQGKDANALAAQQALLQRARCNQAARRGEYDAALEKT